MHNVAKLVAFREFYRTVMNLEWLNTVTLEDEEEATEDAISIRYQQFVNKHANDKVRP